MNDKKIVIVGSGFGGVKTALLLASKPGTKVQLVSSHPNFEYHAALYRSATGKSPLEVVIPLAHIFGSSNVELILDTAVEIRPDDKVLHCESGRSYDYDFIVFAIGQTMNYFGIEGLAENSHSIDTIANTIKLRQHLHNVMNNEDRHEMMLVVAGGGATGVELAAELKYYAEELCTRHKTKNTNIDVLLIEGGDRVLPLLSPKASRFARKRLEELGVKVMLNRMVSAYTDGKVRTNDMELNADTLVWTAGFKNNPFFAGQKDIFEFGRAGRVKVNVHLQAAKNLYVIGDSADTKYSGMAQTALSHAKYVAEDIQNQLNKRRRKKYKPHSPIYAIPVGRSFAVIQWGKVVIVGKLAWLLRRVADLRLFVGLEPFARAIRSWRRGDQRARDHCPVCKIEAAKK